MNKIFRSLIHTTSGVSLELLPREHKLVKAVERCIDNQAIVGEYSWEVCEITMMGESLRLVTGSRGAVVNLSQLHRPILESAIEDALKGRLPNGR